MNFSLEHLQMEQTPLQRPREEKKSHSALTDRWLYGDTNLGLKCRLCISAVGSLLGGLVAEMPHLPSGTEATPVFKRCLWFHFLPFSAALCELANV